MIPKLKEGLQEIGIHLDEYGVKHRMQVCLNYRNGNWSILLLIKLAVCFSLIYLAQLTITRREDNSKTEHSKIDFIL